MCIDFEKEMEDIDQEIKELIKVQENPELSVKNEPAETDEKIEEFKPIKKVILDREWDKPKLSLFILFYLKNILN